MRNRIAGFFLFFCLVAPSVVTLIGLQHQKYLVRHTVKKQIIAGIAPSQLLRLAFSKTAAKTALDWEHASEFEFQGQMFDVVETIETADSVFYRCWLDARETALNRELAQTLRGAWENHPAKKQGEQQLLDFFNTFFHSERAAWQLHLPGDHRARPQWFFRFDLAQHAFSPPLPPPKRA